VRLDRWFKRNLPAVGFATVSRWARTGQLRVDGKRADVDTRLEKGQLLRVPPGGSAPPGIKSARPKQPLTDEQIALADSMVPTKDRAAIVLNKPPGLATQGGSGTYEHVDGLLDAYAEERGPRPRLVHRLDKDTSGAPLIARTPGSAAFFPSAFPAHRAQDLLGADHRRARCEGWTDRPAASQAAGHGRREDDGGRDRARPVCPHALPGDRPRGQCRLLGRTAAADRAHSTNCACTWPPSATPLWAMASMAGRPHS